MLPRHGRAFGILAPFGPGPLAALFIVYGAGGIRHVSSLGAPAQPRRIIDNMTPKSNLTLRFAQGEWRANAAAS